MKQPIPLLLNVSPFNWHLKIMVLHHGERSYPFPAMNQNAAQRKITGFRKPLNPSCFFLQSLVLLSVQDPLNFCLAAY